MSRPFHKRCQCEISQKLWITRQVIAGGLVFALLGLTKSGFAQQAKLDVAAKAYFRDIGLTQADLDGGRVVEAKRRLEAADKSLGSFELEYLQARARTAAEKSAASDLIRKVPKPEVEIRYGVLNEVYRQLVFICRDGKRIASAPRGNVNKFLAVFDVTQESPLFNAGPFGEYVAGMAFTPDGKRIAATGCEKALRLFDAATGAIVLALKRSACGSKPAFSRDGRLLGWSEPDGYYFIDLGRKPANKD